KARTRSPAMGPKASSSTASSTPRASSCRGEARCSRGMQRRSNRSRPSTSRASPRSRPSSSSSAAACAFASRRRHCCGRSSTPGSASRRWTRRPRAAPTTSSSPKADRSSPDCFSAPALLPFIDERTGRRPRVKPYNHGLSPATGSPGYGPPPGLSDKSFMTPAINKPVPEFEALATGGVKFSPQAYDGKIVVLYFYPKDNTPGCTTEAMQFRDHYKEFLKAGAVLFGVSRDNMASHDRFKQQLELPFELIADTEEKLCHMFGVVKNKIMYGKKVKGIERSTFLIDGSGILRNEWRGLTVAGHVDEVLKAVKAIKKGAGAAQAPGRAPAEPPMPLPKPPAKRAALLGADDYAHAHAAASGSKRAAKG